MSSLFQVGGKPFFPLGGQCHNSSSQSPAQLEVFWKALGCLRGNTAEIPVYWQLLEPEEGRFDFTQLDGILAETKKRGYKLIPLWFGSWKNGKSQYNPEWVKKNPERFHRVLTHEGVTTAVLSPHCKANLEVDKRAFTAMLEHIHETDKDGTVIAVQVENEPGIDARSVRDHGPEGEADYHSEVPGALVEYVAALPGESRVKKAWERAGGHKSGDWRRVFGVEGSEFLSACTFAEYISEIAGAGKRILNVPMIVNVWNEGRDFMMPGLNYPSGGAVAKVIDLWKFAAPNIDILGPDIYLGNIKQFDEICAAFARQDNPLFLPETPRRKCNEWGVISAVGRHGAIGYCMFGIEDLLEEDGGVKPDFQSAVDSFAMTSDAIPLLLHHRDGMYAVIQEEGMLSQTIDMGDMICLVSFKEPGKAYYNHRWASQRRERGRGYLFRTADNELCCVGDSFYFELRKKPTLDSVEYEHDAYTRHARYLTIEEGFFTPEGTWQVTRTRSGDDFDFGVWLYAGNRVVRVVLYD